MDNDPVVDHTRPPSMHRELYRLTLILVIAWLLVGAGVLFGWYDKTVPDIIVGRILGQFDAITLGALAYWFQTSHSSAIKNGLVSKVAEKR